MDGKNDVLKELQLRIEFCKRHNFKKYIPGLEEAYKVIKRDMLPDDKKVWMV